MKTYTGFMVTATKENAIPIFHFFLTEDEATWYMDSLQGWEGYTYTMSNEITFSTKTK